MVVLIFVFAHLYIHENFDFFKTVIGNSYEAVHKWICFSSFQAA